MTTEELSHVVAILGQAEDLLARRMAEEPDPYGHLSAAHTALSGAQLRVRVAWEHLVAHVAVPSPPVSRCAPDPCPWFALPEAEARN